MASYLLAHSIQNMWYDQLTPTRIANICISIVEVEQMTPKWVLEGLSVPCASWKGFVYDNTTQDMNVCLAGHVGDGSVVGQSN